MMHRYIEAKYHMTPDEYIAHFNLRRDYPMTAKGYSKEKSKLARQQRLGRRDRDESLARKAPASKAAPAQPTAVTAAASQPAPAEEAPKTSNIRTRQRKKAA